MPVSKIGSSGRYCIDHERQRLYEEELKGNPVKVRAWESAQYEIRRRQAAEKAKIDARLVRKLAPRKPRTAKQYQHEKLMRKLREQRYRESGLCRCGRKPRKGLVNCDHCHRQRHPPGRPRHEDPKKRSAYQKRYYERCKSIGQCVNCTEPVKAGTNERTGLPYTSCERHLELFTLYKQGYRTDRIKGKLAQGKAVAVKDLEDTGDVEFGDAISDSGDLFYSDPVEPRRRRR